MPCIVKLIEIAFDFPALLACQFDCVSKDTVACLLRVETPCIVGRGVLQKYVALPETMRPHRSAEPQEGLILPIGACRRLCDYLFVNVKIALIKARVLLQNCIEGSEHVHIFKFAQSPHASAPFQIL